MLPQNRQDIAVERQRSGSPAGGRSRCALGGPRRALIAQAYSHTNERNKAQHNACHVIGSELQHELNGMGEGCLLRLAG